MPPTILETSDLHKHYRMGGEDLHVLRGVKLSVAQGEWLAVQGASGSGKSTLLHLLGGLDRPDQGTVHYGKVDVFAQSGPALDRYRTHHVGFVFQFYHLLPEFNALENVLIAAQVGSALAVWEARKADYQQRTVALLERLGLKDRLRHRPAKLSGGERQRVAIARALVNRPAVLLADEPTGNLDSATGWQIIELLRQLHQDGQTIVMVTHDDKIAAVADRKLKLDAGRLK